MLHRLSVRSRAIQPTLIRDFRARAGADSLDLGIGQPDLDVPGPVREAVHEAVDGGRAPYCDNLGLPELREAVGRRYGVDASRVMITCGVQEGLAVSILGLVDPGDRVLVPDPGFPAYPNLVRAAGAEPVSYRLDPDADFAIDLDDLRARVADHADTISAIILNSPSNPTGRLHDAEELRGVLEIIDRADEPITWIADDIYEDYAYEGDHVSPGDLLQDDGPSDRADSGLRLGGVSKSMHMMGWRIGWVVGPPAWITGLKPLHQHLVTCAPTIAQRAALKALQNFDALFAPTFEVFAERRRLAVDRARALPDVSVVDPGGAFYLFLDVRAYTDEHTGCLALAEDLLEQEDVVLIPGSGFGGRGEGFLRLAYTREVQTLDEAFDRMERFFNHRQ